MEILLHPSPNHDGRGGAAIDMLVLHYTGMKSGGEALARLCDRASKVSAHYLVEEDGRLFRLVEEDQRAWHAGVSSWRGREGVNARSIGIEIANPGHAHGYRAFPEAQMESVIALCRAILARHPIPPRNVVAHSDVAPARKEDPGELFDWERLAREGVGLWPSIPPIMPAQAGIQQGAGRDAGLRRHDSGKQHDGGKDHGIGQHGIGKHLSAYGYPLGDGSGEALRKSILAFQRHFRPASLSGEWDAECEERLQSLLACA